MNSISAQTKALIELLNLPISFWERITGRRDDAELLSQIADAGEPAAIVDITPFVLSESREVARAAAAAVDKLLARLPPHEFAQLDSVFRERSPYLGRYRMEWRKLTPADLNNLESVGHHSIAILGMASFHESGYVREEATSRLGRTFTGAELPFLLIRLNDWVSNVREVARRAINSRLSPRHASSFVANLPLVARLEQTERDDHRQLVEAIERLLKSAGAGVALLKGLDSPDRRIRRKSFRLAADATDADQWSIVRRALSDQETVIRLWAARRIATEFEGQTLDKFLALMKRDRFMPVRREALRTFVNRLPEQAPVELRLALLDTHVSMREEARYHLRKIGNINLASFYRRALASAQEKDLYPAVSGLGETGTSADARLLIPYTHHQSVKVRRAVIRALSRLNKDAHLSIFIAALQDKMPGVSREAQKALVDRVRVAQGDSLWEIFNSSPLKHVRRNVLRLFTELGKWESIYFLIKATCDSDDVIAERTQLYIESWLLQFNRRFTAPTREQLVRLDRALEEYGHMLDENMLDRLRFSMKGY